MKYMKRANIYKASNVTFCPESMVADSYDWWHFVERINGKIVFNNYTYSPTTNRHQSKVRQLLRELDIKIDVVVKVKQGLQASYGLHSCADLCLASTREAVMSQDLERAYAIAKVFKFKLTQTRIQMYYDQQEIQLCEEYLDRAFDYNEKKIAKEVALKDFLDNLSMDDILKHRESMANDPDYAKRVNDNRARRSL